MKIFPRLSRISCTWSVLTASRPQPKEFSCTRARSSRVGDEAGGGVQARVVDPLVDDAQRPRDRRQVRDGVLGEDRHAQRDGELGDAVIDLGIQVVGRPASTRPRSPRRRISCSACSPRARTSALNRACSAAAASDRLGDLCPRDPCPCELLAQAHRQAPWIVQGQEGVGVAHASVPDALDVVQHHLGIGGHDGAVEVVARLWILAAAVRHARVEDEGHSLLHEARDMAVHELSREAYRFGGDGLDACLVDRAAGPGDRRTEKPR